MQSRPHCFRLGTLRGGRPEAAWRGIVNTGGIRAREKRMPKEITHWMLAERTWQALPAGRITTASDP